MAESEKAVLRADRCGRTVRDITLGRNHLFSSVKYVPADYRVRVADDLMYAPLHNWGGEVHPTVTPQMRRFAWAKYYQASGKAEKPPRAKEKAKRRVLPQIMNRRKIRKR